MNTIHIFYNGNEAAFPENNEWEKFHGHDSVRVFLACCESWRRNGWEVKRLSTINGTGLGSVTDPCYVPVKFTGRIAQFGTWYPDAFWQFIPKACSLPGEEFFFGSYDVFNYGMKSDSLSFRGTCSSFQKEHFSLSLFCCSKDWLLRARQILIDYDSGKLPAILSDYVSDETILRKYADYTIWPWQSFPLTETNNPLIHFARSTLARAYARIPVV